MKNPITTLARNILYGRPATASDASTSPGSSAPLVPGSQLEGTSSARANVKRAFGNPFSSSAGEMQKISNARAGGSATSTGGASDRRTDSGESVRHPDLGSGMREEDDSDPNFAHHAGCPCAHLSMGIVTESGWRPSWVAVTGSHPALYSGAVRCTCRSSARVNFTAALPAELAFHVLSFLDVKSLARVSACSRATLSLANDTVLWRDMYRSNPRWRSSALSKRHVTLQQLELLGVPVRASIPPALQRLRASYPLGNGESAAAVFPSPPSSPTKPGFDDADHDPSSESSDCCSSDMYDRDGDVIMRDVNEYSAAQPLALVPTNTNCGSGKKSQAVVAGPITLGAHGDPELNWKYLYRNRIALDREWAKQAPEITTLKEHRDSVYCIQFDRNILVSGSRDQSIKVWSMATKKPLQTMTGHTGSVLCLQYDAATLVTGSSDTSVMVWDMPSGQRRAVLLGHTAGVLDVAFDKQCIVSCSKDATIKIWDTSRGVIADRRTGAPTYPLKYNLTGHRAAVNAIQLRGDTLVTASGDYLIKVWNVRTGELVRDLAGHTRGIACVAFDGHLVVSGSNDQLIRVWDVHSGKCLHILEGHRDLVRTIAMDPVRGLIVSGSYDQSVKLWQLPESVMAVAEGHRKADEARRVRERRDLLNRQRMRYLGAASPVSISSPLSTSPTCTSPGSPIMSQYGSAGAGVSSGAAAAMVTDPPVPVATPVVAGGNTVTPSAAAVAAASAGTVPKSKAVASWDTTHTSWVFNVALSSTHIISASQDQTIVVYDYASRGGVDKSWIA
ncbi:WD40-repeat-containing domain protein [Blastocladiella britannica]|nr:WD40-repeat-containing domain protein [Blastocladiella britannica]